MDSRRLKTVSQAEAVLALLAALLGLLTMLLPDWIEASTGWSPDYGNGSLEAVLVWLPIAAAVALVVLSRRSWRRYREVALSETR